MMFFTRRKPGSARSLTQGEQAGIRPIPSSWGSAREAAHLPAPDCAIWNDIARALDLAPRPAGAKTRVTDDGQAVNTGGQASS